MLLKIPELILKRAEELSYRARAHIAAVDRIEHLVYERRNRVIVKRLEKVPGRFERRICGLEKAAAAGFGCGGQRLGAHNRERRERFGTDYRKGGHDFIAA
jgi:bifunctional DNA-binding transcriptional regulator/antitoxin component of YhaV-PrlF toxin-antitoxin module